METSLATVEKIEKLSFIPNADAIEVAKICGWNVVVKKNEFQVGDKCVYCQIDTVLPDKSEFSFLKKNNFRIKTIRLRGQLSQGIAFPLSILPGYIKVDGIDFLAGEIGKSNVRELSDGYDVTDLVGIKKYEKPVPAHMAGMVRGKFPDHLVMKTDEIMVQNILYILDEIKGQDVYMAVKADGTSGTFLNRNGDRHVCSRNLSLKEDVNNVYWQMYCKYDMDNIFKEAGNFAIQGEVCGEGIQKNKLGIKGHDLFVFDVFNIDEQRYLDYAEFLDFCSFYNLKTVKIEKEVNFDFTLDELLEMAKGVYDSGKNREGIVIRPVKNMVSEKLMAKYGRSGRVSFKVLNNDFLEKDES